MTRWSTADLADAVETKLRARTQEDDLAQSVYGIDALDELKLHPILRRALLDAGYGAWREQRYPSDDEKSKRSHGKRCDLVLTPDGLPLRDAQVRGTIFDTAPGTDPDQAYWLEIKTVAQHETTGPFARYSSELFNPVAKDVQKLWKDPGIRHAGLLIVLFTEDRRIAEHDLLAWHDRCIERGFPVMPPALRGFGINDRIGNGHCAIAVFGVRG